MNCLCFLAFSPLSYNLCKPLVSVLLMILGLLATTLLWEPGKGCQGKRLTIYVLSVVSLG